MTGVAYLVRGGALALAWFVTLNAAATVLVTALTRRLENDRRLRAPAFWLAMRLAPALLSLAFVLLLFAPSYWRYEPRVAAEKLDFTLALLALAGLTLIASAAARGRAAWRAACRRTRAWRSTSQPLSIDAGGVPMSAVDGDAPMMALAGVFRPRLVVTRRVLDALTVEELHAGVAHELGHWRARDNLKRLAMRAAPDLLSATRSASALERRWAAAAEHAADAHAGADPQARCALASALVKIARLTPAPTPLAEPISTLVDGGDIAVRVQRLLADPTQMPAPRSRRPIVVVGLAAAVIVYGPLLQLVHALTEAFVHSLP